MRDVKTKNGLTVKAYAGTTGVLLAMNIPEPQRKGLLGFAIERQAGSKSKEWLAGMLPFPHMLSTHKAGELIPTNKAPIQKFRWSDYRVYPGSTYTYTVHPVYGTPQKPDPQPGPTVKIKTAGADTGDHRVLFNRAAAASQAFSRKFRVLEKKINKALATKKKDKKLPELSPPALKWLSRGVLEQIVGFLGRAVDNTWALDIAIYEYELKEIVDAVNEAHARGADVRVVYHAKKNDKQTTENAENLKPLPAGSQQARLTNNICHDKFIVLSRLEGGKRSPVSVLCGSTNFTVNAVYRQANVVHVAELGDVAQQYLDLFEELFGGADQAATRAWIGKKNAIPNSIPAPVFVGFSPRNGGTDLNAFVHLIEGANRDVLFCTAFDMHKDIYAALQGKAHDSILRYGVQDKKSAITGLHADRTAAFSAVAQLSTGLEGFLKESMKGLPSGLSIHTKVILVDFTSDSPTIISGSHNYSSNASKGNDENYLILRGNTDLADCYGCEIMRIYDHYRFRWVSAEADKKAKKTGKKETPTLKDSDVWTDPYFAPKTEAQKLKMQDRLKFAG